MTDVHSPAVRSKNMRAIRSKNTRPEITVRSLLHAAGFRYRLHVSDLPGKPDLVFPKYRAVIMVKGCFWHGHDCPLFKWPSSNIFFWRNKIKRNQTKDAEALEALKNAGWRVMVIWECALKGKAQMAKLPNTIAHVCYWLLQSDTSFQEISRNAVTWHNISG